MIEQIKDLQARIETMEEANKNVLRVGDVVGLDKELHRCRVQFKDNDDVVSFWCQVIAAKTKKDAEYWLPDVGEMVICVFLPYGHEQGFIIGSAFNQKDIPPEVARKGPDRRTIYQKGPGGENIFIMDRNCSGKVVVIFDTDEFHIYGKLVVHGEIEDIDGNLTKHTNEGYLRDITGPPGDPGCYSG